MITAIVFILVLGILIFVHELGHFLTARRNGIRAEEFGFGFPPRIFGIQKMAGKKMKKIAQKDEIEIEISEYQNKNVEIVKEKITETIREIDQVTPVKKWRWIWGNYDGDDKNEIEDHTERTKEGYASGTIYSLNWIPLGGFVRIKGENGDRENEPDSFAAKGAWVRIKVLAAGVLMNFALAWVFIALALMLGAPADFVELVDKNIKIEISGIAPDSPAAQVGLKSGDEISRNQEGVKLKGRSDFLNYINSSKGKEINLKILRGGKSLSVAVTPRLEVPENQGPLGVIMQTEVKYPILESIWKGLLAVLNISWLMLTTLFDLLRNFLTGQKIQADIAGPVGIAIMTKQAADMGFVSLILFVAFLSINLGIINAFPIPALDGGRILFILIEKIKGSPVSQKTEQAFHTVGFFLLIALMILITFRDVTKFIFK